VALLRVGLGDGCDRNLAHPAQIVEVHDPTHVSAPNETDSQRSHISESSGTL
jgi:hypothetical protein